MRTKLISILALAAGLALAQDSKPVEPIKADAKTSVENTAKAPEAAVDPISDKDRAAMAILQRDWVSIQPLAEKFQAKVGELTAICMKAGQQLDANQIKCVSKPEPQPPAPAPPVKK